MCVFVLIQAAQGFLEVLLISVRHEVCGTFNKGTSFRNVRRIACMSVTEKCLFQLLPESQMCGMLRLMLNP